MSTKQPHKALSNPFSALPADAASRSCLCFSRELPGQFCDMVACQSPWESSSFLDAAAEFEVRFRVPLQTVVKLPRSSQSFERFGRALFRPICRCSPLPVLLDCLLG